VHETLLQSCGITPNPSARTSLRPTLSQLAPRARVRGFCVPYLHKTCLPEIYLSIYLPTPRAQRYGGISPDSSVGLPANPRSRAVVLVGCGSQLAVGGLCTQEATDGDCWLPAARVLASGEERFVQASSRIVLSVCRLILAAVP
jgi:hypothetical protein